MIERNNKGQFAKGSKPVAGFIKGERIGDKHPQWKGGIDRFPKCSVCEKRLSRMDAKNCSKHSFSEDRLYKIKKGSLKRIGTKHWNWKGDKASYRSKHFWIERKKGKPTKCEHCGEDGLKGHKIHWANVSQRYLRKLSDWIRLCTKCHGKFDSDKRKNK